MLRPQGNLVHLLRRHASDLPAKPALRFLEHGERETACWTYADLDRRARALAVRLAEARAPGRPVLLVYPPGLEFAAAFCACLYAGAIAVTTPFLTASRSAARIAAIAADADPCAVLSCTALVADAQIRDRFPTDLAGVPWIPTDTLDDRPADRWRAPDLDPGAVALLQYTSGSTAAPRGVVVRHGNLIANLEMIRLAFGHDGDTRMVSWLPLFHDMGLVGGLLQPLFLGGLGVLMSPLDFIQRPIRWLKAIDRYRATSSGAPNFAYGLCAERVRADQVATLDLGSWRVAFCGAEPVRAETLARFARHLAPAGFDPRALFPCYGLAEATLFVSGGPQGSGLRTRNTAAPDRPGGCNERVSCGSGAAGQTLAVVDPRTREPVPPGATGEVWVAGPHVGGGYWRRDAESAAVFGARLARDPPGAPGFLRTGDLGHTVDGELFITGRLKDVLIVRGAKHHPEDIEDTVARCHPSLAGGAAAVFAAGDEDDEGPVVLAEVGRRHLSDRDLAAVASAAYSAVCETHGVRPRSVALVRPGSLPRTSSNKVQRGVCRTDYLEGRLRPLCQWGGARPGPMHNPVEEPAHGDA